LRTQQGYGIKNPRRQKSKRAINTDSALEKAQSKKKEAAGLKFFFSTIKIWANEKLAHAPLAHTMVNGLISPNTITMQHSLLFTVHFDDSNDLLGSDIPTPFDTPNRFLHDE
jgi:hypothetical protein